MRLFSLACTLILALVAGVGCVERLLQVKSEPSAAAVYINGQLAGETPLAHPFVFYGTVDVVVRAPGHLAHFEEKPLPAPWYQYFPLDLFAELMVPWTIRDVHVVEVALRPALGELDERARGEIQARAGALGAQLDAEAAPRRP